MRWIEFFQRQLDRCKSARRVSFPENRSQTTAIGPAKTGNKGIELLVGNFRGNPVHARLSIQSYAKWRSGEAICFQGSEHAQSAGIEMIDGDSKCVNIGELELPTVPQIRHGFKWTIISAVVIAGDLKRVFWVGRFRQIDAALIVVMRQDKAAVGLANQNLPNTKAIP